MSEFLPLRVQQSGTHCRAVCAIQLLDQTSFELSTGSKGASVYRVLAFCASVLVISPETTYKTGQMSVRPSLRLRDLWADVDETWYVYCMHGSVDKNYRKRNFAFRPMRRAGEMTQPDRGAFVT